MRLLVLPLMIPLSAAGMLLDRPGDEPSELEMRGAFEEALAVQVRNALEFVEQAEGTAAVQQVRQNGTDRFQVVSFQKLACKKIDAERPDHRCDFAVNIGLINGSLRQTISGRFVGSEAGLTFVQDI
jgi:hypothetical protein